MHKIKYKEIEKLAKLEKVMEKHYGYDIPDNEPYFTTSQETDINEMISDGLSIDDIIKHIKKW